MCCIFIGRWLVSFRQLFTIIWMCETESDKCRFLLKVDMLHKKEVSLWVHQVCSKRHKSGRKKFTGLERNLENLEPDLDGPDVDGHINENIHLSIKKSCLKRNVNCTIGEEGLIWRRNQAAIKPVRKKMHTEMVKESSLSWHQRNTHCSISEHGKNGGTDVLLSAWLLHHLLNPVHKITFIPLEEFQVRLITKRC